MRLAKQNAEDVESYKQKQRTEGVAHTSKSNIIMPKNEGHDAWKN